MLQSPPPSAEANTALVPLADCYLHPLNTRSEPPPADIEALAASIEDNGLLQNLNGWLDPEQPGRVGIVAGGRRLRALLLLAARDGRDLDETRVAVKIAPDEDTARIWAGAENSARVPLNPAEEIRTYSQMMRQGYFADTIARRFAVTERHVRQRLKLAKLPDTALDALRDGSLSLDQAAALTVAASEDALDAELRRVLTSRWPIAASDIRHQLQRAQVRADDKRVLLIGLDAYRAAGGAVQEDLFTDQVRLLDEALLDRMVSKRLDDAVAFTLLKGWKWAEVILDSGTRWEAARKMQRIERHPVELPEADAAELEDLHSRGEEAELSAEELARMDELEEREMGDYADDDIATSGVILYLEADGTIASYGAYRRAQDDPTRAEGDPGAGASGKVETKALSAGLIDDLHKIRLAALQHRAATQPELMLDLLGYQASGGFSAWDAPLRITLDRQPITPEKAEGLELPGSLSDPDRTIRGVTSEGFAAFRALGKKHRNEDMTQGLARTLTTHRELAPFLAAQLKPNPREIWTPTADGYFKRLPVPHLDSLWDELVPADRREGMDFQTKKKGEKATILHRLFNEADFREALGLDRATNARLDAWLPEQLQWPTVEGDSDA